MPAPSPRTLELALKKETNFEEWFAEVSAAFREGGSIRRTAEILEVPHSLVQRWRKKYPELQGDPEEETSLPDVTEGESFEK